MQALVDEAAVASQQRSADDTRFKTLATGVLVLAAALFFARLGARALWSSEFRWAEICREMELSGNYFWPTINGRLYYDKPLLSYWMVLGAAYVTGSLNETAARIPCAAAGLLGVALLMLVARRRYDGLTAVLAGLILATSLSFVFFSRHASADVETIAGELTALLLFLTKSDRPDGWWLVPLWLVMAVTSLTKGLLGFALPLIVIGSYSCLAEGWKEFYTGLAAGALGRRLGWFISRNRWFFNWKSVPAIALAAIVYAAPFEISSLRMHSSAGLYMVYRENVMRFFHPFDHRGPIYLYVYAIFALMAPWSALLPAALAQAHRRETGRRVAVDRFALVYFWATFVFFTLSGSRRSYYILPILPAAALLVARLLAQQSDSISATARVLLRVGCFAAIAMLLVGAGLLLPPSMRPARWSIYPPTPERAVFALGWIASLASVFYALWNFRPLTIAGAMATVAYLSMTYLYVFAMPATDAYRGEKAFAKRVTQELHGDVSRLAFFRTQGPLFYLNPPKPIAQYDDPAAIKSAVHSQNVRWVIVRRRDVGMIGLPTTVVASEATFPWEDDREARNKEILLNIAADSAGTQVSPPTAGVPVAR